MTHTSEPAMARALTPSPDIGVDEAIRRLREANAVGDHEAMRIVRAAGTLVGQYLTGVVNIFDPKVIVLRGEVAGYGESFIQPLQKAVEAHVFYRAPPMLLDWTTESWPRGAAALATQAHFVFETSLSAGKAEPAKRGKENRSSRRRLGVPIGVSSS